VVRRQSLDGIVTSPKYEGRRVCLIKIDVEGHELSVLKGALGVIARDKPVLLIEMEYCHNSPVAEIFALLGELGYGAEVLDHEKLVPVNAEGLKQRQPIEVLRSKLAGEGYDKFGYINNVIFRFNG
jgi:hypothetical protein